MSSACISHLTKATPTSTMTYLFFPHFHSFTAALLSVATSYERSEGLGNTMLTNQMISTLPQNQCNQSVQWATGYICHRCELQLRLGLVERPSSRLPTEVEGLPAPLGGHDAQFRSHGSDLSGEFQSRPWRNISAGCVPDLRSHRWPLRGRDGYYRSRGFVWKKICIVYWLIGHSRGQTLHYQETGSPALGRILVYIYWHIPGDRRWRTRNWISTGRRQARTTPHFRNNSFPLT